MAQYCAADPRVALAAAPGVAGLAAVPPEGHLGDRRHETAEEVTAKATAADVTCDQTQVNAVASLPAEDN
jgi:hypothetical protein